jgi:hypothetical protein
MNHCTAIRAVQPTNVFAFADPFNDAKVARVAPIA